MNKVASTLILIFTFFLSVNLNAQDIITEKNNISFSILGSSSYVGVTYERMLTDNWVAEVGVGLLSVGFGATYYPWEIKEDDISFDSPAKGRDVELEK